MFFMGKKNLKFIQSISDSNNTLENRLLQGYVVGEIVWAAVNLLACLIIGMPLPTMLIYASLLIGVPLLFAVGHFLNIMNIARELYLLFVLLTIPVMWYLAGGSRSTANILFVCELILFTMCTSGRKQKLYIIFSLASSGLVQNVARHLPYPNFPMTDMQYNVSGSVLGLSTSLLIAFLLLNQKAEYAKERDAAIESEQALERSNALQKNFLANMSHEIRSPLGIVLGFNNLIKDSNNLDSIYEYSKDIAQAGTTLLTVINDILDYSKIESGKLDIIEADYSFHTLVDEIKKDIGLKCAEKGLTFETIIDDQIPASLFGDNIRIKQCLLNLLSNAVKYTDKGGVTFEAKRIDVHRDGMYTLQFVVKDTGKGISEEAIGDLFTAFQRLDEGTNRGIEGTGLGLAITKNLLDEMHGDIAVTSKLGEGSTFIITIDQSRGNDKVNFGSDSDEINLAGIKALVVDDTELNLMLVSKLLAKDGVETTTINNGKDCLVDVEQNKYDIILLDHMMPEMNGVEVYKRIKEQNGINANTPIIMLTANAMAGADREYSELGFDGYISKPINPKALRETIANLVRL